MVNKTEAHFCRHSAVTLRDHCRQSVTLLAKAVEPLFLSSFYFALSLARRSLGRRGARRKRIDGKKADDFCQLPFTITQKSERSRRRGRPTFSTRLQLFAFCVCVACRSEKATRDETNVSLVFLLSLHTYLILHFDSIKWQYSKENSAKISPQIKTQIKRL